MADCYDYGPACGSVDLLTHRALSQIAAAKEAKSFKNKAQFVVLAIPLPVPNSADEFGLAPLLRPYFFATETAYMSEHISRPHRAKNLQHAHP